MKILKRAIALILILVLVLSLSACGGFSSRMAKAAVKMQKVQNMRMDIGVDLGMNMSLFGEAMDLDTTVTGPVDIINSPLKLKAALDVSVMEELLKLLCYAETDGADNMTVYSSPDGGQSWTKTVSEIENLSDSAAVSANSIKVLAGLASFFKETGTETVRGSDAIVYSGSLTGDQLEELLNLSEALNTISQSTNLEISSDALDFSEMAPVPITLCIDRKSNMLVKYSVDLTSLMQVLLPVIVQAAMDSAMAESGLGDLGDLGDMDFSSLFQFDLHKLTVSAELYDFDKVGEITIPPEALAAEELAA